MTSEMSAAWRMGHRMRLNIEIKMLDKEEQATKEKPKQQNHSKEI